jgi:hypothetical protein
VCFIFRSHCRSTSRDLQRTATSLKSLRRRTTINAGTRETGTGWRSCPSRYRTGPEIGRPTARGHKLCFSLRHSSPTAELALRCSCTTRFRPSHSKAPWLARKYREAEHCVWRCPLRGVLYRPVRWQLLCRSRPIPYFRFSHSNLRCHSHSLAHWNCCGAPSGTAGCPRCQWEGGAPRTQPTETSFPNSSFPSISSRMEMP